MIFIRVEGIRINTLSSMCFDMDMFTLSTVNRFKNIQELFLKKIIKKKKTTNLKMWCDKVNYATKHFFWRIFSADKFISSADQCKNILMTRYFLTFLTKCKAALKTLF